MSLTIDHVAESKNDCEINSPSDDNSRANKDMYGVLCYVNMGRPMMNLGSLKRSMWQQNSTLTAWKTSKYDECVNAINPHVKYISWISDVILSMLKNHKLDLLFDFYTCTLEMQASIVQCTRYVPNLASTTSLESLFINELALGVFEMNRPYLKDLLLLDSCGISACVERICQSWDEFASIRGNGINNNKQYQNLTEFIKLFIKEHKDCIIMSYHVGQRSVQSFDWLKSDFINGGIIPDGKNAQDVKFIPRHMWTLIVGSKGPSQKRKITVAAFRLQQK